MRHQREGLEDEAHVAPAQLDQLALRHGGEVGAIDQHGAGGGLDQPVEQPDKGRLARAGQAHDDEDLARAHAEARIVDPGDGASVAEHVVLGPSLLQHLECQAWPVGEDLVDVPGFDPGPLIRGSPLWAALGCHIEHG